MILKSKMKAGKYFLLLAFFLIILFTQFYHPVNGLADDQIGLVTAEKVIQNISRQEGYKDLMEKYIETGGLHPASAMGLPWINTVYTFVTHNYSSLVGLSIAKWHFLSVLLFLALLFFAQKLGNFFFGRHGFIFPLLLATNLYVLVVIRNSIILFSLSMAIQFAAMYYFMKVHEKFRLQTFGLVSLFLFLALSNGSMYSPVVYLYLLITLVSLLIWWLAKKVKNSPVEDFHFLRKKYYLFLFLGVPLISIVSYFVNDIILNTPLGSSLDGFLYFTKSKFSPTEFPTLSDKFAGSLVKFKGVFLGTSFREIFGPHVTFFPYQTPVLDKAAAFLFFLGLLSFFKNFTYKKLILLSFLIYTSYYLHEVGANRIFIVFVPFLLLISSAGFVFLLDIIKAIRFNNLIRGIFLLAIGGLLAYNVYFFEDYFVVKSNSNLLKGTGIAEVKSYIDSIKGNKVLVFMERGYPAWYLADFRKTDFIYNLKTEPEEFRKEIKNLEGIYDHIILIFPTDFGYIGNPGFLQIIAEDFSSRFRFFQEAFPERPLADRTIYDYQGIPQHYLYHFSKDKELPKTKRFIFKDPSEKLPLGFSGEIESLRISGGVKKVNFGDRYDLEVKSSPHTEVIFNLGKEAVYSFYPNFSDNSFKENLNQQEKLMVDKKFVLRANGSFTWIEPNIRPDQPPYLLEYIFDFPYQIKKLEIKNDARIFNGAGSQAAIKGYMVDEENHFNDYLKKGDKFVFLKIESDNSNTYGPGGEINVLSDPNWGMGRLSSYAVLKPKNDNKVLIALLFESKYYIPGYFLANLYNIGRSTFFKFTLDIKGLEKPIIKESAVLSIERDDKETTPVIIDILYK